MKKIVVIALAVVMMFSVLAFAACGDNSQTVTGEVSYESFNVKYGVKVDVTVKNDTITAVNLYTDEESGYCRTSPDDATLGWEGYDETEAAYDSYIKTNFIGKSVSEVNAYVATATAVGQTVTTGPKISGSTQSSARIICAIQNALSKLGE